MSSTPLLDVFFTPAEVTPADVHGRTAVAIDVLRASTTILAALNAGARSILPCATVDDAITLAKNFEPGEVVLAGERRMLPIPGFALGNSPTEFHAETVGGKDVILTTTNGTAAIQATTGAHEALVGAFANARAIRVRLRRALRESRGIAIVCGGGGGHFCLEDAACAGRLIAGLVEDTSTLSDAARAALLLHARLGRDPNTLVRECAHGRALAEAGFGEDLQVCGGLDTLSLVPAYLDRRITRLAARHAR